MSLNWNFLNIDPSNIITQCGSEYKYSYLVLFHCILSLCVNLSSRTININMLVKMFNYFVILIIKMLQNSQLWIQMELIIILSLQNFILLSIILHKMQNTFYKLRYLLIKFSILYQQSNLIEQLYNDNLAPLVSTVNFCNDINLIISMLNRLKQLKLFILLVKYLFYQYMFYQLLQLYQEMHFHFGECQMPFSSNHLSNLSMFYTLKLQLLLSINVKSVIKIILEDLGVIFKQIGQNSFILKEQPITIIFKEIYR
ncbi:unnamed protein product [Paramecium octaurelia]|uniref:Transmembrane protein n=1 Tax=Paramecium octaurelia TaxID=43137 RepID=A0A8S1U0S4_PAROT|nr:unnamed protein product [Paramecium octaurelia]